MDEIPRASGVYQIRCVPTGKIYVGSARDLRRRWGQHRRALRRHRHHNPHLQAAWDKYGEESFSFEVFELIEYRRVLDAEQRWSIKTGCFHSDVGFNIFDTAGSPGEALAKTWTGFIDPDGNTVTIKNLSAFCREHGLDWPSMHRLATGKSKLKSYRGWTHKNSIRKRSYVQTYTGFISPNGTRIGPITKLAAFCRLHALDTTHMVADAHGRINSHRGWTYDIERQNGGIKKYTNFVDPTGTRVTITNLAAFCRKHGLHPVHMHQLKSGQRKNHKGWTWRETNE